MIMDEVEVTWPTLHPLRHQHHDATNRLAEHLRTPTWPLSLQTPNNHTSPQLQPDLYLQLSQILEWEIWNHNQTRGGLCSELARRTELEAQVYKLNQELAQWQESCRIAYGALDEHRAESSNLKLDVEALTDELRHLRELQVRSVRLTPSSSLHGDRSSRSSGVRLRLRDLTMIRELQIRYHRTISCLQSRRMMRVRGVLGSFETLKNIEAVLSSWGVGLI
jgi:hypothetical protein